MKADSESARCRTIEGLAGRIKIKYNPTFVGCKCNFRWLSLLGDRVS
jgi:hypothetical protein